MKLIGYTLGITKVEQELQKADLLARFPDAKKVYSESCSRNGTTGKPTRQTRGHALNALKPGDVLVTDKLEYLAADGIELAGICTALLAEGVHIVSTGDDVDTRKDSMFRDFMASKISKKKAEKALAEARLRGARQRHVRLPDEALAVINQVVEEGATGLQRKQLRQQLVAEQEAKVLAMLKENRSPFDIGRELGVDNRVVRNIAKHHGLNIDRRFKSGIQGRILGEADQKVIGKRLNDGERAADLAREYGVSYDSVYRIQRVMEGRVKLKRYQNAANSTHAETRSQTA